MPQDFITRFAMQPHVEGGHFCLLDDREASADDRHSSGVIYYTLSPGEHADFHSLDCDEYWLYHAGATLEVWIYDQRGQLRIEKLGLTEDAQPCVLVRAGELFGARPVQEAQETTLLSCVTVPQFTYDNYRLLRKEEMLREHPDAAGFFD